MSATGNAQKKRNTQDKKRKTKTTINKTQGRPLKTRSQESSSFAEMHALMNENGNGKAQNSARPQLLVQLVNGNGNYATKKWHFPRSVHRFKQNHWLSLIHRSSVAEMHKKKFITVHSQWFAMNNNSKLFVLPKLRQQKCAIISGLVSCLPIATLIKSTCLYMLH